MGCNACPGLSSQTGAFIVAILDVGSYIISIWHEFASSTGLKQELFSEYEDYPRGYRTVPYSPSGLLWVLYWLGFLICVTLLLGVYYGSRKMLMAWMISAVVHIIIMFLVAFSPSNRFHDPPFMKFLVKVYFLKVVYDHFDELKDREVPGYCPARIEIGNPEGQGQGQGQGHDHDQCQGQVQGQANVEPTRGFASAADYDPELGSGFDLDALTFAAQPLQHQPAPRSTELPPSYESCLEKMPMPPSYESCTGGNSKT